MKWKVIYRSDAGGRAEMFCEADSRQALFSSLSQKGITAIRIEAANGKAHKEISKDRKRMLVWGVLCLFAIVAVLCVLRHSGSASEENPRTKKRAKIAEVKPVVPKIRSEQKPVERKEEPPKVVTNFVNNVWHDEKGRPHYKVARTIRPGQNTIINGKPFRPEKPVFHHASEVELDVLLSRRPGERIFGDVNWKAFERDLPSALIDKVEILPDDTPEIIARKQAVMEAKKELAEAIKAGEDPVEILKVSRDEVNRLADIRDGLLSTIAEMKQEGADEQEIEDAVEAANVMLKEHNIDQPLVSPRTMRERAHAAKLRKLEQQKGNQ